MYEIRAWKKTFENARSRPLKTLDWIQCPAGVGSNGCIELMSLGDDGVKAFGVFILLCQWTAKLPSHLRGRLCRSDGQPLCIEKLATHVRVKPESMAAALELLSTKEVGWIVKRETEDPMFRSTHDEDLNEQPTPENPAINYDTPERLPVDTSGPIPFGLSADVIETADMLRVEAAFLTAWHSRPGVAPVSGLKMAAATVRVFRERCFEPGWLAQAEAALKLIPPPYHVGTKKLFPLKALIDDPESALLIASGSKYAWNGKKDTPSKPSDKTHGTTAASQRTHEISTASDKARTERERAYRARLAEKWGADAGLLTDKDIADLDAKQPSFGLYGLKITGTKKNAAASMTRLYVAKLHEVMEVDSGGKSFTDTEQERA